MLAFMTPGGFMNATAAMATPAQSLNIPPKKGITYATADLGETIKVFRRYGIRFLAPDEIATELPALCVSYPAATQVSGSVNTLDFIKPLAPANTSTFPPACRTCHLI